MRRAIGYHRQPSNNIAKLVKQAVTSEEGDTPKVIKKKTGVKSKLNSDVKRKTSVILNKNDDMKRKVLDSKGRRNTVQLGGQI